MDREADDYALLAEMTIVGCQFVVRQYRQRAIDTEQGRRDVTRATRKAAESEPGSAASPFTVYSARCGSPLCDSIPVADKVWS
jgi:hypothetical protein